MHKGKYQRGHSNRFYLSTAALLPAIMMAPAYAQTTGNAADGAAPSNASRPGFGDIVVTAQKREESIQRVPISLQAIGSVALEQHQVQSFDDYAKMLPSVSYQSLGPGQSQLFFRGIASGGDGLPVGALPTASVYLDEIPVTTIGALLDVHIYDVARVEALSGPQGTLYGASSLSGTLRIITNKPNKSKFEAGYDLQLNKFGKGNPGGSAEAFINLPLSDRAAFRMSGFYVREGGYIDSTPAERTYQRTHTLDDGSVATSPIRVNNAPYVKDDYNSVDSYGGRAALGIDLDDNWTVTPAVAAQHLHTRGSFLFDPRAGHLKVHAFTPEYNIDKWYQASLTVEGKLSDWDVLYSGGYLQRSIKVASDYSYYTVAYDSIPDYTYFQNSNGTPIDPTQRFLGNQALTKQTHELRVASPAENPWRLTAGIFFQRQSNQSRADYVIPGVSSAAGYTPVIGDNTFLTNTHIVNRDYAVFAQATIDLTPSLTFTGGIRGFIAKNTLTGFSGFPSDAIDAGCRVPLANANACQTLDKKAVESGETHKVNLTWQVDQNRMVYATYSTGFRPGGNNRRPNVRPFDADTLDNFELGWKTSWFDDTLRWNGAVYYQRWKNLQYALVDVTLGNFTNIFNAGTANVYGIESDIQWRVGQITLSTSGSYNNAKLATDFCAIGPSRGPDCSTGIIAAPKGTRLPTQPRFKVTGTARYDFNLGSLESFLQGAVLHQSSTRTYLGIVEGNLLGDTPAFTSFDFSAGTKFGNGMSAEIFIQNAFGSKGELSRNTFCVPTVCGPYYRVYPIKPQQFGIKFGQRF